MASVRVRDREAIERAPDDDRRDRVGRADAEAHAQLGDDALHRTVGAKQFLRPADRGELARHTHSSTGLTRLATNWPHLASIPAVCELEGDLLRYIAMC